MRSLKKFGAPIAIIAVLAMVGVMGLVLVFQLSGPKPQGEQQPVPSLTSPTPTAGDPVVDEKFAAFYGQDVTWEPCDGGHECTTVKVPKDWDEPASGSLDLHVVRVPATGSGERGHLLMNPGGPGASGFNYVADFVNYIVTPEVREAYSIVGFDPRGVGKSAPVDCLPDAKLDAHLFDDLDPETPEGLEKTREAARTFAAGCVKNTGDVLGEVDTVSAARDMDVIRAVVGDERLDYLGKSYGTLLGATYAGLYPHRVGRLVLDGAIDPALTGQEMALGQSKGIEQALYAYLENCLNQQKDCPFSGSLDEAKARVTEFLDGLQEKQLPTSDPQRQLTPLRAATGIIATLYSDTQWPSLSVAFSKGFAGDGTDFQVLADGYADREKDGSYSSNILEAFTAINCLDYPTPDDSDAAVAAFAKRAQEVSPVLGRYMSYGEPVCAEWPHPPVRKNAKIAADGAPPILVVGTTGDMATPYEWSQALAEQLSSGRLLTYEGEGHTAYMKDLCVNRVVDDFLLNDLIPGEEGTRCG